jgi:hypothetical protein
MRIDNGALHDVLRGDANDSILSVCIGKNAGSVTKVSRRPVDPWFLALILVQSSMLAISAFLDAPTEGEAVHLSAGLYIWNTGRFDVNLGNPPLVNIIAAAPTSLFTPDLRFAHYAGYIETRSLDALHFRYLSALLLGRLACIPFSVIGAATCYFWAVDVSGRFAGRVALILWCFCPNLLGHGHIVTGDVACTSLGVLAGYSLWRWLSEKRLSCAIFAGAIFGLALLTKMVMLLWLGLVPLLWFVSLIGTRSDWPALCRSGMQLLSLLFVAVFVVNLGYAFEATWQPFPLTSWTQDVESNQRLTPFKSIADVPIPLPANYLRGFRDAYNVMVSDTTSFLRGEWRSRGWLYYYFYGLFVKLPLGNILLTAMALWVFPRTGMSRENTLLVLVPGICFALAISSLDGLSHHFRYFLPVFPFAYIWLATTSSWISQKFRLGKWAVGGCLALTAISTLWQFPHVLAYFNELSGGPLRGHRHLVDTSLDCGQDLYLLRNWLLRHPEVAPLRVIYSGSLAPQLVDVEFVRARPGPHMRMSRQSGGFADNWRPESGWYAISVNFVAGKPAMSVDSEGKIIWYPQDTWAFFQHLEPVVVVGRTIWIYEVSEYDAAIVSRRFGWESEGR